MKKIIFTILILGIMGSLGYLRLRQTPKPVLDDKKIHYHAGFVVFENGKKLDFSDTKYMFIKPCTVNGSDDNTSGDEQIEKAHLHDNVGDVVHIETKDAVWSDLFTNIKFPVDYLKVTGYINGNLVLNFQEQPINPYDSLVLFIGKVDVNLLKQGVTKEYIQNKENSSTTCGEE